MNKPVLLIGIGQFGCSVADEFARTMKSDEKHVHVLAIDTDERILENISHANVISMAHPCQLSDVLDSLDTDILKTWFPCDRENDYVEYFECLTMNRGCHQWRMKSLLSFNYYLSLQNKAEEFFSHLDTPLSKVDEADGIDIVFVASTAGGTGSGLFIPLNLYIKNYYNKRGIKNIQTSAILAMPEICGDLLTPEQLVKAYANTYATVREINTMNLVADGYQPEVPLKIGNPDDPYFGLLYDSENEEFKAPENKPFNKIYLFSRILGVNSVITHVMALSENIRCYLREAPIPQSKHTTDAVCGGMNLYKTIYPQDSIVSYISTRNLYETANKEWLYLYNQTVKEFSKLQNIAFSHGQDFPENAKNIAASVLPAIESIYYEQDLQLFSALLKRKFEDPKYDKAPNENTASAFVSKNLFAALDELFKSDEAAWFEQLTESLKKEGKKQKKSFNIFGNSKQKEQTLRLAEQAGENYINHYNNCIRVARECEQTFKDELTSSTSPISIFNILLKNEGCPVHPVYAWVCVCQVYSQLENLLKTISKTEEDYYIENPLKPQKEDRDEKGSRSNKKIPSRNREKWYTLEDAVMNGDSCDDDFENLPKWIIGANKKINMACKYSKEGTNRLMLALRGETKHIGDKAADERLLCYDIVMAYDNLKNGLRKILLKKCIDVLGELIVTYYNFFKSLSKELGQLSNEVSLALVNCSTQSGLVYYVGNSPSEKQHIYNNYLHNLRLTKEEYQFTAELDSALGQYFIENHKKLTSDWQENSKVIEDMFENLRDFLFRQCKGSEFYNTEIKKNIMEILLNKNDKYGGDSFELAIRKAFIARSLPLKYTISQPGEWYEELHAVSNRFNASLSTACRDYIEKNPQLVNGYNPKRAMEDLFCMVDEAYGESSFRDHVPENEMHVFRESMGFKFMFVEELNEKSENPLYFKAYKKALAMCEQQVTELWNPHIICSYQENNALPQITQQ